MNEFTSAVRNAANEVFQNLGHGHSEATYQNALEIELRSRPEVKYVFREITFPILYKGVPVGYQRADFIIQFSNDEYVIVELKSVKNMNVASVETQIRRYLSQFNIFRVSYGIIINFPQNTDVFVIDFTVAE
jgi:GxxExxY protein